MQPGKAVHSAIREAINASRSASSWARESSFSADFSETTRSKISMLYISSRRARICRAQDGAQEPFSIRATVRFCRLSAFMSCSRFSMAG